MRILVLADVHANLSALEAVLQDAGPWDEMLFLGDAVIGGPHPNETCDLLRSLADRTVFVMGNHDEEILETDAATDPTNPDRMWLDWLRRVVTPANRAFLATFQPSHVIERDGLTIRLHHGHFTRELGGRLWPDSPDSQFAAVARAFPEPHMLTGHTHVQYRKMVEHGRGGVTFINPGSVGQPRMGRCEGGRPLALYGLLENGRFTHHAAPYDVARTNAALEALPLPRDYIVMWQRANAAGRLAERYRLYDLESLRAQGYR